uniref:SKP1 component dimerisation domain-containing protein n=1 Tax=Meloidogyne incognita TaxID=6306 RepID=A0A914MEX9_MELIC
MSEESIVNNKENGVEAEDKAEENVLEPALYNYVLTEEQKQRKIKCVTWDDKVVEVEWHLMMQCGAFVLLWESLNLEDSVNSDALDCFHFPLNEITEECIVKVVEWLRNHQGQGPIEIKYDHITGEVINIYNQVPIFPFYFSLFMANYYSNELFEADKGASTSCCERKWFHLTDWEKDFFEIDFEFLKEIYLASNFLDIKSLYYYCAQEAARCIMDKSASEIRSMLQLPDDLTEAEKQMIAREYEYHEEDSTPPPAAYTQVVDESNMVGTSASFLQPSSSSSTVFANVNGSEVTLDFNGGSGGNNNNNEGAGPSSSSSL